jgi:hypothetical protein
MAVEWADYGDLLNELSAGTTWAEQNSYSEFRNYLGDNYSELGPDGGKVSKGYESLLAGLLEDMSGNEEEVYKKVRIITLAYPDPDDPRYVVSVDFSNQPVRLPAAELYTAEPAAWEPAPAEAVQQRVPDEATGLMFDAENWYTPEGVIVYLDSNDRNWSYDDDGNWYERGIAAKGTAGQESAAPVSSAPKTGLTLDPTANLRYDDLNWYLPDRDVVVYLSPDHPGFSYDNDGNWYEHGDPWAPTEASITEASITGASTATSVPVDDELILEKGAEVLSDLKNLADENGIQLSDELARKLQDDPAFKEEVMKIAKQLLAAG